MLLNQLDTFLCPSLILGLAFFQASNTVFSIIICLQNSTQKSQIQSQRLGRVQTLSINFPCNLYSKSNAITCGTPISINILAILELYGIASTTTSTFNLLFSGLRRIFNSSRDIYSMSPFFPSTHKQSGSGISDDKCKTLHPCCLTYSRSSLDSISNFRLTTLFIFLISV